MKAPTNPVIAIGHVSDFHGLIRRDTAARKVGGPERTEINERNKLRIGATPVIGEEGEYSPC